MGSQYIKQSQAHVDLFQMQIQLCYVVLRSSFMHLGPSDFTVYNVPLLLPDPLCCTFQLNLLMLGEE